jgi:hypothetical protein
MHDVRLVCARPDLVGRRLSQGDRAERAHQLSATAIIEDISAATMQRLLVALHLTPWRPH